MFWLEAIDPPQRAMSNSNVTLLILASGSAKSKSSFGFLLASSRQNKQKDRQRECAKDLLSQLEQLLSGKAEKDLRTWCQVPEALDQEEKAEESDASPSLEKLRGLLGNRLAATGRTGSKALQLDLEIGSSSCVLTAASSFDEKESEGPDVSAMDAFSPDAGAQLSEAQRLGGLLRLQWHLAVVKAKEKGMPGP